MKLDNGAVRITAEARNEWRSAREAESAAAEIKDARTRG